jgi:hypothetical protein
MELKIIDRREEKKAKTKGVQLEYPLNIQINLVRETDSKTLN